MGTGCRIKSGMTELDYLIARLIYAHGLKALTGYELEKLKADLKPTLDSGIPYASENPGMQSV